jgi:hypothetical protein
VLGTFVLAKLTRSRWELTLRKRDSGDFTLVIMATQKSDTEGRDYWFFRTCRVKSNKKQTIIAG